MPFLSLKLPYYAYIYFFCQSINLITAVIAVAVSAVVGNMLAPDPLYATVPYGMQFFFLLIGTYPASALMQKYGRKIGFVLGSFLLCLAGVTGYVALVEKSFLLLILTHGLIGLFTSFANFYRYAVTDRLPKGLQPQALSLVIAGGVIAGVIGPMLSSELQHVGDFAPFSLCYGFLVVLAGFNLVLIYFLPVRKKKKVKAQETKTLQHVTQDYTSLYIAMFVAAIGYGLMNLLMIQSSLKMNHMHVSFSDSAFAIQCHVIAMFFPSFFTGKIISNIGHTVTILAGFLLLIASFILNVYEPNHLGITAALILLGLGWNFTYTAGSSLLTYNLRHHTNKQKLQGIADTVIAVFATLGAMSPSFLLNKIGWNNSNYMAATICVISFFIVVFYKGKLHDYALAKAVK